MFSTKKKSLTSKHLHLVKTISIFQPPVLQWILDRQNFWHRKYFPAFSLLLHVWPKRNCILNHRLLTNKSSLVPQCWDLIWMLVDVLVLSNEYIFGTRGKSDTPTSWNRWKFFRGGSVKYITPNMNSSRGFEKIRLDC